MLHFWFTSGENVAGHFQKKNKNEVHKRRKSGKWKILKNEAAEKYLEPCQISIMERFCIIDVWYSSKYTPEVVLDSKIYLKQRNTKMLAKTVYFFNVDLAEGTAM